MMFEMLNSSQLKMLYLNSYFYCENGQHGLGTLKKKNYILNNCIHSALQ